MTFRLTPALSILILAGCASSEPQNVSYAPLAAQPMTMQAATLPPPSLPEGNSAAMSSSLSSGHATTPMPTAPTDASMPPQDVSPAATDTLAVQGEPLPPSEADIAAGVPTDATNCSTVDGVTLCDAPFDPVVDATHNTN